MKRLALLLTILLISIVLKAQYKGGAGGGYAAAKWLAVQPAEPIVTWGSNPGLSSVGVDFQVVGAKGKALIKAFDAAGRLVLQEEKIPAAGFISGNVGKGWAAGIYLIQLEVDGTIFVRKQGLISQ